MKRISAPIVFAIVLSCTALAFSQTEQGGDIINRRDQARNVFLATPKGVFQNYCAHCHGETGRGDGRFWTSGLSPAPTDLSATELDQAALVKFITQGSQTFGRSNFCPPWGRTISSQNITRLSRYLLSLSGEMAGVAPEPPAASELAPEPVPWLMALIVLAEIVTIAALMRRVRMRRAIRRIQS